MAKLPQVINVTEEADGAFTAHIVIRDTDTQKVLRKAVVRAASKAEFKDKLRPHLERYLADEARRMQLLTIANEAVAELITELGY